LVLGESTRVTLSVDGRCGIGEAPTDIVLTVLYLPQGRFRLDNGTDDPAAPIIRELRQLVARIDLSKHRLGIVAYWSDTQVELPLTADRTAVLKGIQAISRRWPCQVGWRGPECTAAPNVSDALRAANAQFPTEHTRRRLILLYQPDYCNRDFEYRDGECLGYVPAETIARTVRDGGTQIVVFDGNRTGYRQYRRKNDRGQTRYQGDAQPLASSDADVVFTYDQAQHRMVAYQAPAALATGFRLVDEAPGNMRILSTRISPPATVTGQQVQWDVATLPYGASRFELPLQPLETGRWPTNVRAVATFTDGWGRAGQITFPVPQVEVVAPTPMPEEPTPTARPPTVTPAEPGPPVTATPGGAAGGPVYLPVAMRGAEIGRQ
jgi:hypothetical protein